MENLFIWLAANFIIFEGYVSLSSRPAHFVNLLIPSCFKISLMYNSGKGVVLWQEQFHLPQKNWIERENSGIIILMKGNMELLNRASKEWKRHVKKAGCYNFFG
jgi:hypothetical protein